MAFEFNVITSLNSTYFGIHNPISVTVKPLISWRVVYAQVYAMLLIFGNLAEVVCPLNTAFCKYRVIKGLKNALKSYEVPLFSFRRLFSSQKLFPFPPFLHGSNSHRMDFKAAGIAFQLLFCWFFWSFLEELFCGIFGHLLGFLNYRSYVNVG